MLPLSAFLQFLFNLRQNDALILRVDFDVNNFIYTRDNRPKNVLIHLLFQDVCKSRVNFLIWQLLQLICAVEPGDNTGRGDCFVIYGIHCRRVNGIGTEYPHGLDSELLLHWLEVFLRSVVFQPARIVADTADFFISLESNGHLGFVETSIVYDLQV